MMMLMMMSGGILTAKTAWYFGLNSRSLPHLTLCNFVVVDACQQERRSITSRVWIKLSYSMWLTNDCSDLSLPLGYFMVTLSPICLRQHHFVLELRLRQSWRFMNAVPQASSQKFTTGKGVTTGAQYVDDLLLVIISRHPFRHHSLNLNTPFIIIAAGEM